MAVVPPGPLLVLEGQGAGQPRAPLVRDEMMTRSRQKAAVPQEPTPGPISSGVIASVHPVGTRGPAAGHRRWPSGSASKIVDIIASSCASIAAHRLASTSWRLAPAAIISSVPFAALSSESAALPGPAASDRSPSPGPPRSPGISIRGSDTPTRVSSPLPERRSVRRRGLPRAIPPSRTTTSPRCRRVRRPTTVSWDRRA